MLFISNFPLLFNLRGNQRTSGELSRKEGGKIFGSGSRTPISITILVRKPNHTGSAAIHYEAVADYLSREEKLALVSERGSMLSDKMSLSSIAPNQAGDWINQRDGLFETFIGLAPEKKYDIKSSTVFVINSRGLETSRDSIVYSSCLSDITNNVRDMISRYNKQREEFHLVENNVKDLLSFIHDEDARIIWTRGTRRNCANNVIYSFDESNIRTGIYRPFFKQHVYVSAQANEYVNHWLRFFPTPQSKNLVICVSGANIRRPFSCLITDVIPDLHIFDEGTQCFPLYWYEKNECDQLSLFDSGKDEYKRHSGLSNFIVQRAREEYGPKVTAEDVFYYVYGFLHSQEYRQRFANNLKKGLARIHLAATTQDFKTFVKAGRKLADLHLNYESIEPHPSVIIENDSDAPTVQQMRFGKSNGEEDKSIIHFNDAIRIINIPLRAYDWQVNGKSPIEWIMERYAVTVNRDSQIRNDPNDWCREHGQPRYILDLIGRIVNVSIQTLDLMASLPPLSFKT